MSAAMNGVYKIKLNDPPMNTLGHARRKSIVDQLNKANLDTNVKSIVIYGEGVNFCSGADVKEFSGEAVFKEPTLWQVLESAENSAKPVVAAIRGICMGGGLELSLSCHYRVVAKNAKIGFPEVRIGLLPGATGTQKLPRLVGMQQAMTMCATGQTIDGAKAGKIGLADEVVDNDDLDSLLAAAERVARSAKVPPPRVRDMRVRDSDDEVEMIYQAAMGMVEQQAKGLMAPALNLKACKAATLPYEEGLKVEESLFRELFTSDQSRALQYVFFAQRLATKSPVTARSSVPHAGIARCAVIGGGTMGSGIAAAVIRAGFPCHLVEANEKLLEAGRQRVAAIFEGQVKRGRLSEAKAKTTLARLTPTLDYAALREVDLVIEAVFENMALKKEIFAKLDKVAKPGCVLATNTSTLDIDEIGSATSRPGYVVGMHFFAPANVMQLLENVRGRQTNERAIDVAQTFGKSIGKVPVLVRNCYGFLANRMFIAYGYESDFLLEDGATPTQVDTALEKFGFVMGIFRVRDLSGVQSLIPTRVTKPFRMVKNADSTDVGVLIFQERLKALGVPLPKSTDRFVSGQQFSGISMRMLAAGRLGTKTGMGFYKYDRVGGRRAEHDPAVDQLLDAYRAERALPSADGRMGDTEIIERCVLLLINEGFRILEDRIVDNPESIDIIWIYGFGFPPYRGGPMYYASQLGLAHVYDRVLHYSQRFTYRQAWQPAHLLEKLAQIERAGGDVRMRSWTKYIDSNVLKVVAAAKL